MKANRRIASVPTPDLARRATVLAGAGLVLAAVAVYANTFSGPFLFDDFLSIPQNPTIRSLFTALVPPGGGVTVTGRPVLNLSFALNHALSGDHVWSYHALNLLIHVLAGLILFGILRRTLAGPGASAAPSSPGAAVPVSFAAALLWLVHPLQTESVTYLVQRAESLMGLFYLLTLYCFIRGAEPGRPARWFVLSFVSCLLGMGTKEVMVSAPFIVLLYDRTFLAGSFAAAWQRRGRVYLALASTWLLLAALVLLAANRGGSAGFGAGVGFGVYVVTQFEAVSHYLWLSVWPHPLILDYGVQWVASAGEAVPYALLVVGLATATLVALVRRPRPGFLGAWFFALLAPTSLVPVVRQTLAEHRMYLALAPVTVLLVVALHRWAGRRFWFVLAAVAVAWGVLTMRRNLDYRSSAAIWLDTVTKRPGNAAARNNYGNLLAQAGDPAAALVQFDAACGIDPAYAEPRFNAGNALEQLGRLPEAAARYEEALRLRPEDAEAHDRLGNVLHTLGHIDDAIAHYQQAVRLQPGLAAAHEDLGRMLAAGGRLPEAIAELEKALAINPSRPEVHNDLGMVLAMTGRTEEGLGQFEQALRLNPNLAQAHLNLALTLENLGRSGEAARHYEAARRLGLVLPPR